jgi:hypothetical protein
VHVSCFVHNCISACIGLCSNWQVAAGDSITLLIVVMLKFALWIHARVKNPILRII